MPRPRSVVRALLVASAFAAVLAAQDGYGDPTFATDGVVLGPWNADPAGPTAVIVDGNGGLFIGGNVGWEGGDSDFAVRRLRRDGESVVDWGVDGKAHVPIDAQPDSNDRLADLVRLGDGSLLLAGFSIYDLVFDLEQPALAKLTPDGNLDTAFGDEGIALLELPWPTTSFGWSGAIHQPDGKVIFFGYCYQCPDNNGDSRPMLLRLTTVGAPDTTFSGDGWEVPTSGDWSGIYPYALALDDLGRILVFGSGTGGFSVTRLNAGGLLDASFGGGDGTAPVVMPAGHAYPYSFAVDPASGAMFVAMAFGTGPYDNFGGVIRLTGAGAVDPGYAGDGLAELVFDYRLTIYAIGLQSDGKLAGVGGIASTAVGHDYDFLLFRLLSDGMLDDDFHDNGVRRVEFGQIPDGTDSARAMTFSGGRLVAVGPVTTGGIATFGIARTQSELVFTDGFERGSSLSWAETAP